MCWFSEAGPEYPAYRINFPPLRASTEMTSASSYRNVCFLLAACAKTSDLGSRHPTALLGAPSPSSGVHQCCLHCHSLIRDVTDRSIWRTDGRCIGQLIVESQESSTKRFFFFGSILMVEYVYKGSNGLRSRADALCGVIMRSVKSNLSFSLFWDTTVVIIMTA